MFMALRREDSYHCGSSPGLFDECILNAMPPTLKPSQPTWPVNQPAIVHINRRHLFLLFSKKAEGGRLSRRNVSTDQM